MIALTGYKPPKAPPGRSGQARKLLAVLQQHAGQWLSRSAIADELGKSRLNPNDHRQLTMMVDAQIIAARKTPVAKGPIGWQWEYRYEA